MSFATVYSHNILMKVCLHNGVPPANAFLSFVEYPLYRFPYITATALIWVTVYRLRHNLWQFPVYQTNFLRCAFSPPRQVTFLLRSCLCIIYGWLKHFFRRFLEELARWLQRNALHRWFVCSQFLCFMQFCWT